MHYINIKNLIIHILFCNVLLFTRWIPYKFAEATKKKMMAVYENAQYKGETENEKRDSSYEELEQIEGNTEQDKVYTELK